MRGDNVAVVSGPETGKTGAVRAVLRSRNMVIVEGANMVDDNHEYESRLICLSTAAL